MSYPLQQHDIQDYSTDVPNRARALARAANHAARAIPPVWPLASSVAINPFLGQSGETLAQAGARLARVAGLRVTMPRAWYREKMARGDISPADLRAAWENALPSTRPADFAMLEAEIRRDSPQPSPLPTIAHLAAEKSGLDWPGLIAERFGTWAAGYFDEGQALWAAPRGRNAYAAWRAVATHDLTPEIIGLPGFAQHVSEAPENNLAVIARAVERLDIPEAAFETYFHQMLMTLGGWAQVARYALWQAEFGQAELAGGGEQTLQDFLAIRLLWEEALFRHYGAKIAKDWAKICISHAAPITPTPALVIDTILQDAAERAAQRTLTITLAQPAQQMQQARPAMQAVFCIDVRSEVFRRALESLNPSIQTIGFAGFFGLGTAHRRFASDVEERRLPVLLNPALRSCSGVIEDAQADQSARISARARRAWGRFKLAAVSSFAFVEATGPVYIAKLVKDTLSLRDVPEKDDPAPRLNPALGLPQRIKAAETVLRAMSLTRAFSSEVDSGSREENATKQENRAVDLIESDQTRSNFAKLVLIAGHGAQVVNNPHASALHCGACGGYSGEVNARLLASLLNDPETREGLVPLGITIPADTLFIAALHETTTDSVTLYTQDQPITTHQAEIAEARGWLTAAGRLARSERALRLPRAANDEAIHKRSRDWAETRPEWALAGCKAFIAAPRQRTIGKNLAGRAFLHDYDWRQDGSFGILELILTAPVVVASWISLQYYGSTVAPEAFGGGNKLLHNVTGGIGVVEGNGGLLRPGLPWQSIHDGTDYVHEPLRLSVCIEAPRAAMTDILARQDGVRTLFDHGWLHLFALDEKGRMAWRYAGNLNWHAVEMDAV